MKRLFFFLLLIICNCIEKSNETIEHRIIEFVIQSAESQYEFNNGSSDFFELTKLPFDSSLIRCDIYQIRYLLRTPTPEFFIAHDKENNKIINLDIIKNNYPINFSKIISYNELNDVNRVDKLLRYYFQIYKGTILNTIFDVPGVKNSKNLEPIIKPMEIKQINNDWEISLFSWSHESGLILQHEIRIGEKIGFIESFKEIAENIGEWKAPM